MEHVQTPKALSGASEHSKSGVSEPALRRVSSPLITEKYCPDPSHCVSIHHSNTLWLESSVTRKFRILLVDDDPNDRLLFASALEQIGMQTELFEATSGYAGLDYLLGQPPYDDRKRFPFPDLMLLDLKMPGMDGFSVLKHLRAVASTKDLPVFVFSNSNVPSDVRRAYALGANAYHQKPSHFIDLVALLRIMLMPWLKVYSHASHRKSAES